MVDSKRCPRCHDYGEDIFHLIVDCSKSRSVWEALGERTGARHQVESMEHWGNLVKNIKGNKMRQAELVYCAWLIWKDRNEGAFSGKVSDADSIAKRAMSLAEE